MLGSGSRSPSSPPSSSSASSAAASRRRAPAAAPKSGRARADAYAHAIMLRRVGWTVAQIAADLGVSRSYVYDLINDPSGDKARARKQRVLRRPCVDCGNPTWGERCEPCRKTFEKAAGYWTDERVLAAAREWRRRTGDWPKAPEWKRAPTLDGYRFPNSSSCCTPDPDAPSHKYDRPWRSWAAFLIAAGADPNEVGMARTARAGTAALAKHRSGHTRCAGCGCPLDEKTVGCRICRERHRQRELARAGREANG